MQMTLHIQNLSFSCIIGILKYERKNAQKVLINLSFQYTFKNNIFLDYAKLAKKIEKIMLKKKFKLLEDGIIYLKKYLNSKYKSKYNIKNIKLKISKPDILPKCKVTLSCK